ncbi:AAA family ATPase [Geomonas oryzisoli]|uniref:AAA family ATPase n=1 Tax=Geomonas oryzisoli TaxID=2847992 RepID=A0ABX8J7V5_9BACT|nr:AAA domain-containing protein [Geomonas oryzisoli]QWV93422.1 AAA family ATPase [Geomonas oryzisoli]
MIMFNQDVIEAAGKVAGAAQNDFFKITGNGAVIVSAVAGAGKSYFVTDTVKKCRALGLRVAVGAPTNEQVFSLVRSIADSDPGRVAYIHGEKVIPPLGILRPNVAIISPAYQATGETVLVGTIHKLASAINPQSGFIPALGQFDALIIDESFQATSANYFAVAGIAPRHLCVGDSGQILPFTTVEAGLQWKGLAEDPLQTAVGVLRLNHPNTPLHRFPITRRLDSRGALIARNFYSHDHHFEAAVADGVRTMKLGPATAVSSREKALDKALSTAAQSGWAYLEQPAFQTLILDPVTGQLITDLICRLMHRTCTLTCERNQKGAPLDAERIAVVVSHNDQKDMVRGMLNDVGLAGVVVNTANKLQGLEFDVVVCWHPMAGLDEPDKFHLEAGRLCVMCTRHRHACFVVGRRGDRELVEGLPPATPAYPGSAPDDDDILRGWEVHQGVFSALTPYLVQI